MVYSTIELGEVLLLHVDFELVYWKNLNCIYDNDIHLWVWHMDIMVCPYESLIAFRVPSSHPNVLDVELNRSYMQLHHYCPANSIIITKSSTKSKRTNFSYCVTMLCVY